MFSHLVTVLSSAMFTGKKPGEQRQWAANFGWENHPHKSKLQDANGQDNKSFLVFNEFFLSQRISQKKIKKDLKLFL